MMRFKKKITILVMLLSCISYQYAQPPKKVLFIGNSITSFNDMPWIFEQLTQDQGDSVIVKTLTVDGVRLKDYLGLLQVDQYSYISAVDTIANGNYDFVIVQDALTTAITPIDRIELFFYSVEKFDSICQVYNCKLVLFKPYPIPIFPTIYCGKCRITSEINCTDEFLDSFQLLDSITTMFEQLSEKFIMKVAPIGDAFVSCSKKRPELNLYADNEDFHPSFFGSYLMACIYYRICFSKPINSNLFLSLNSTDAVFAQHIANDLVLIN